MADATDPYSTFELPWAVWRFAHLGDSDRAHLTSLCRLGTIKVALLVNQDGFLVSGAAPSSTIAGLNEIHARGAAAFKGFDQLTPDDLVPYREFVAEFRHG